jgi:anti-sigma regulatory factor (Ser/Thr protein kinase)
VRFLPSPSGAPLGVGGVPFEGAAVVIPDAARLLLFTDGLIESRGVDLDEGLANLAAAFAAGPPGLEDLCDHILQVLGRADGHDDDVAMLVAQLRALEPERIVAWPLHGADTAVAEARLRIRAALIEWRVPELAEIGELLVSELATNAVKHGTGPMELQVLLLDEVVSVSVSDTGAALPRFRRASEEDESGRGLQVVATLASRWGARATVSGKVVWCELPRPRVAPR